VVEEVGAAVIMLKPADRVLISRITACGKCVFCRKLGVVTLHKRPRLDRSWSIRRIGQDWKFFRNEGWFTNLRGVSLEPTSPPIKAEPAE